MNKPTLKHYFRSFKTGEMVKIEGSPIAIRKHETNNHRLTKLGFRRIPPRDYESNVIPIGPTLREIGVGLSYQTRKQKRLVKPKNHRISRYVLNQFG